MYSIIEKIEQAQGMLSVAEVAKILGVSGQTVYKMANKKPQRIPAIKILGQWKFDPKTLSYWVRDQNVAFAKACRETT